MVDEASLDRDVISTEMTGSGSDYPTSSRSILSKPTREVVGRLLGDTILEEDMGDKKKKKPAKMKFLSNMSKVTIMALRVPNVEDRGTSSDRIQCVSYDNTVYIQQTTTYARRQCIRCMLITLLSSCYIITYHEQHGLLHALLHDQLFNLGKGEWRTLLLGWNCMSDREMESHMYYHCVELNMIHGCVKDDRNESLERVEILKKGRKGWEKGVWLTQAEVSIYNTKIEGCYGRNSKFVLRYGHSEITTVVAMYKISLQPVAASTQPVARKWTSLQS
ncbi:hypothetical protein Fmac_018364 [Flemingia macrophylla]|uniref:Uncharacterized protein n=1 Tax=Flemingia macrophylla TaxID=520843 RepID=A0ABD1M5E6_9FABA